MTNQNKAAPDEEITYTIAPLEDYEQEIYDHMDDYETEELGDDGKMVPAAITDSKE